MSLRPLVIGNWKMNGTPAGAAALGSQIAAALQGRFAQVEVALCPPHPLLALLASDRAAGGVELGAQDVSLYPDGAYTGEVSARLLADLGCRWVIVGHSERRSLCGETSETVAKKAMVALKAGLQPVVCVGESLEDRESHATEAVIAAQLEPLGELLSNAGSNAVIAYEPVWAIGTGRTASPEQAGEVHAFIRARLAVRGVNTSALRILYGGSVKPDNAASLFAVPGIDGGLIGGASLKAADFVAICVAAAAARASS
jgi:triosephosphate isomerase